MHRHYFSGRPHTGDQQRKHVSGGARDPGHDRDRSFARCGQLLADRRPDLHGHPPRHQCRRCAVIITSLFRAVVVEGAGSLQAFKMFSLEHSRLPSGAMEGLLNLVAVLKKVGP